MENLATSSPKKRQHRSQEEKRGLINDQASSGLTIKDFCDSHKIYPTQFYTWKRKLFTPKKEKLASNNFVEITSPSIPGEVEVHFPNGVKVILPNGSDLSTNLIKSLLVA